MGGGEETTAKARGQAYLDATLPIVALTCVLTPVRAVGASLDEVPRWALPLRIISIDLPKDVLETHFVLSDRALKRGRYYTVFTHMVLHESHEYLASNMIGLLLNGFDVFEAVGRDGMLLIYALGGVLAALDRKTKAVQVSNALNTDRIAETMDAWALQLDSALRDAINYLPKDIGDFAISRLGNSTEPMSVKEPLERGIGKVARRVASIVEPYFEHLGCSAGVSALAGANFVISIENLGNALVRCRFDKDNLVTIAWSVLGVFAKANYLLYQYTQFRRHGVRNRVDNAGHITGFTIGIGIFVAFRLRQHMGDKKKIVPP